MKNIKRRKGFTIVELVIVIGVIGVLAGILIPTFVNVTKKAEEAALKSNLANAYSTYVADAAGDGEVDEPSKTIKDYSSSDVGVYTIELVAQDKVVLVSNDTAATQYHFVSNEWKEADSTLTVTDLVTFTPTEGSASSKTALYGTFLVKKLSA